MPIDYRKYPPDWKTRIRPDILRRANNRCEICGVENGATVMRKEHCPVKIVLTIAHLDHDRTNNDYGNLMALCQKCHLGLDMEQHRRNAAVTRARQRIEHEKDNGQGFLEL